MAPIVRAVADSGIQVVYAEPLSGHPPGLNRHGGIGLKKAGKENWEDLYDVKLFQLEWTIQAPEHVQKPGQASGSVFLARMGMPPREPDPEMMRLARAGQSFENTGWFIYASVMKAIDALPPEWITMNPSPHGYPRGDDVVISLPDVASGLQDSMKEVDIQTGQEVWKRFEFRTVLPEAGSHPDEIVDLEHLHFIQLLPNELPSYHFRATATDTPTTRTGYHDHRIYTWFSTNANTSDPNSNRRQGLRETTPPTDVDGSSSTCGPPASAAPRSNARRLRSDMDASSTKSHADAKIRKKTNPTKTKIDRLYKPGKDEEEELEEVKVNKRKKRVAEDARLYRPNKDDYEEDDYEEAQEVKSNRRLLKFSEDARSYKPEKGAKAARR